MTKSEQGYILACEHTFHWYFSCVKIKLSSIVFHSQCLIYLSKFRSGIPHSRCLSFICFAISHSVCRGERRFEKPLRREGLRVGFEEVGSGGRKEFMRSDSDNWRTLREEHELEEGGDTGGSWRLAGSRRDGTCTQTQMKA